MTFDFQHSELNLMKLWEGFWLPLTRRNVWAAVLQTKLWAKHSQRHHLLGVTEDDFGFPTFWIESNRNEVKLNLCEWLPRFVCSINSVSMTCDPNARKGDILKFSIGFKYHIYISFKLCNEKIGKLVPAMMHSNFFWKEMMTFQFHLKP